MIILENHKIFSILYYLNIILFIKKTIRFVIYFFGKKYVFYIEGRHKFTKIVYSIPVGKKELDIPGNRIRCGTVDSACLHVIPLYHGLIKEYACRICNALLGGGKPLEIHVEMPGQEKNIEILLILVQEIIHLIPVLRVICGFELTPEAI